MRSILMGIFLIALSIVPATAGETSTLLAGLMSPSKVPSQSFIVKVGGCSVTCGTKKADKSCTNSQSCSCNCDDRGDAVCGDCK